MCNCINADLVAENEELRRLISETPKADAMVDPKLQRMWEACMSLTEKADFKHLLNHAAVMEEKAKNAITENEELKKQVSALTEALETQKRENQPYIKELEGKVTSAKLVIEAVVINYETNPDGITDNIIEKAKEFLAI